MPIFSSLGSQGLSLVSSPKTLDFKKTRLPEVSPNKYSTEKIKKVPQEAVINATRTPDDYRDISLAIPSQ